MQFLDVFKKGLSQLSKFLSGWSRARFRRCSPSYRSLFWTRTDVKAELQADNLNQTCWRSDDTVAVSVAVFRTSRPSFVHKTDVWLLQLMVWLRLIVKQ